MPIDATAISMLIFVLIGLLVGIVLGKPRSR